VFFTVWIAIGALLMGTLLLILGAKKIVIDMPTIHVIFLAVLGVLLWPMAVVVIIGTAIETWWHLRQDTDLKS
jgi:hypothetical protein